MRLKTLIGMMIVAMTMTLSGCGGGGGGGGAATTTVSGVASKGLIKNGVNNVKVFALGSNGAKGTLLATTSTGASGEYSANVGTYAGLVLVEVSGTYTDEATGQPVTIAADKPLRAACSNETGNVTVAVTPLTELAVQNAEAAGALTLVNITAANAAVSTLFNLDVIATMPVAPEATALSGATKAQKEYTLALAAISQMAGTNSAAAVFSVIDGMKTDIQANSTLTTTAAQFVQALNDFAANGNNNTGVTSSTLPAELINVGSKTAVVTLSISGVSAAVYGVDVTVDLPSGVTVAAGTNGSVAAPILSVTGAAEGSYASAQYIPASGGVPAKLHIAVANGNGFTPGAFVTIACSVAQGVTPNFSNALVEPAAEVVGALGVPLSTAAVTLSAAP